MYTVPKITQTFFAEIIWAQRPLRVGLSHEASFELSFEGSQKLPLPPKTQTLVM